MWSVHESTGPDCQFDLILITVVFDSVRPCILHYFLLYLSSLSPFYFCSLYFFSLIFSFVSSSPSPFSLLLLLQVFVASSSYSFKPPPPLPPTRPPSSRHHCRFLLFLLQVVVAASTSHASCYLLIPPSHHAFASFLEKLVHQVTRL